MAKAKFIGVYASTRVPSVRAQPNAPQKKRYWFAWEDGWGRYRLQLLDAAFQPLDAPRIVSAEEFKSHFTHQPHILVTPVVQLEVSQPEDESEKPSERRRGTSGDTYRDSPLSFEKDAQGADKETEQAAEVDRRLRSEFALALTRWRSGDKVTPLKVFENMCKQEEGIIPAHKHMFTDFAIDLRKSSLPALATRHYQRAVELAPEDCNAHFNLARIYYETGKFDKAEEHLHTALELAPDFAFATRLLKCVQNHRLQLAQKSGKKAQRSF
ncbi:MAG: tetratricopeptide repeat protein [Bilophila sp.]